MHVTRASEPWPLHRGLLTATSPLTASGFVL